MQDITEASKKSMLKIPVTLPGSCKFSEQMFLSNSMSLRRSVIGRNIVEKKMKQLPMRKFMYAEMLLDELDNAPCSAMTTPLLIPSYSVFNLLCAC